MTTDSIELPELPEPDGSAEVVVGRQPVGTMDADVMEYVPAWSEKQMRSYALLAVQKERERIHQKGRELVELRADMEPPLRAAYRLALTEFAEAIRKA